MKYHIALCPSCDLEAIARTAQAGKNPRHTMWDFTQLLGATIHQPTGEQVLPIDRMRAKIIGTPEYWALARKLSLQLQEEDIVYCTGEHIGFPIAALCSTKQKRPKIIVFVNNINRPRARLALKLFRLADRIDLFVTTTSGQAKFLHHNLRFSENRVYLLPSIPIDASFFTPGPTSANKSRPIIGSGGLEKRDYRTLADATQDLNVDVKICAFSPSTTASTRSFPKIIPSNMSFRFYDWCDLLQLYRDSDVVVLSLFDNNYQAGLTTMFEAMACRRPVIVTRSPGVITDLINSGIVTGVNPCDPIGLKQAIQSLLHDSQKAEIQAHRGYELVHNQHNHSKYVQALVTKVISTFRDTNNSSSLPLIQNSIRDCGALR
ncbi:MAG: glycosyltransferase family 4 protein [Scytonema sp. RU_4_4]|nr:glycosyltransferase family 4 protein [Scytonema sp. RU_4_4]NJR73506.1 glycosyltransferase family 4 protein [Scytonema sp. CRU_2_7]